MLVNQSDIELSGSSIFNLCGSWQISSMPIPRVKLQRPQLKTCGIYYGSPPWHVLNYNIFSLALVLNSQNSVFLGFFLPLGHHLLMSKDFKQRQDVGLTFL